MKTTLASFISTTVGAILLSGLLPQSPAFAGPPISGDIKEFPLPNPAAAPCEMEIDQDLGFMWIEEVAANAIGRLNLSTGAVTTFPLPDAGGIPGGMDRGPDGGIWFTEMVGNALIRLDPANGSMRKFPLPWGGALASLPGLAVSDDIESGADGAMWFTMIGLNAIGRIDLTTYQMTKYQIPTPLAGPVIIKRGPNDTMVFPELIADKVGSIDIHTGVITEFQVPTPAAEPQGVTTGPDGAIWFTESLGQKLGRIDPSTGAITEKSLLALRNYGVLGSLTGAPLPSPGPILTGSDGQMYFIEAGPPFGLPGIGNLIGRYDIASNTLQEFQAPTLAAGPCDLNAEQAGFIYFGEFIGNKIGKLTITD